MEVRGKGLMLFAPFVWTVPKMLHIENVVSFMENAKLENMLNLALDATQREREKSLTLDVGYDQEERTW